MSNDGTPGRPATHAFICPATGEPPPPQPLVPRIQVDTDKELHARVEELIEQGYDPAAARAWVGREREPVPEVLACWICGRNLRLVYFDENGERMTSETVEYSITWTIGRSDPLYAAVGTTEKVEDLRAAVAQVLERDRFEGRELADTEYDLYLIRWKNGEAIAELWLGPNHETFHAVVALARTARASRPF